MATSSQSPRSTPQPVNPAEVVRKVTAGIPDLDSQRADGYAGLLTLRAAKHRSLTVRAKLYAAKYGADDARIARVVQQGRANARLQRELTVVQAVAATPVPEIDAATYVLHGFVRTAKREALPNLTVALYDRQGQWLRPDDYRATDENGHFEVRYKIGSIVHHSAKAESQRSAPQASTPAGGASAPGQPEQKATSSQSSGGVWEALRGPYEIRVYDADRNLVHRESQPPVKPTAGVLDTRDITIDDPRGRVVEPPDDQTGKPPPAPKPTPPSKSAVTPAPKPSAPPAQPQHPIVAEKPAVPKPPAVLKPTAPKAAMTEKPVVPKKAAGTAKKITTKKALGTVKKTTPKKPRER